MTYPMKSGKSGNIVLDKSKGFSFVIDDMTDEEYFDFVKNHSIMMMVLKGADDERDKPRGGDWRNEKEGEDDKLPKLRGSN